MMADTSPISEEIEIKLRAAMDAQEFHDENDWLAPPSSGSGFMYFCAVRFLAYLERFNIDLEGTPPVLEEWMVEETPENFELLRSRGFGHCTYFAQGKTTGRIKIGLSKSPQYRVSQLQHTQHGESCKMLVWLRGDLERGYHRVFSRWLVGNEWFAPHPDLLAEIDRLKALKGEAI